MFVSTLTVRNITPTHLELQLVERYKALEHNGNGIFTFHSFTTSRSTSHSAASAIPIAAKSMGVLSQNVNIAVAPFTTREIGVKIPDRVTDEIIRLTFEAHGERYSIEVPCATTSSQTFGTSVPQPKHEFTGVFLPEQGFLAIFSSAQLQCWMEHLRDETPLSALSIPGTHNSPTYHKALPSVRCQAVSPRMQLENGVRFLDVRVQPDASNSPRLTLVHGAFPISLSGPKYFRSLLDEAFAFLEQHPSETIIMSLKREGTGDWSGDQLARVLFDHYTNTDKYRWYTDPTIPTLGQARGRIVLVRRFAIDNTLRELHDGRGWGIDAECWADNTAHDNHGDVCVQDFYEVLETVNIEKKLDFCQAQLERAAECVAPLPGITTDPIHPVPPHPFYLNFLSASNFWKMGCWPNRIAARVNPVIKDWLCRNHAQNTAGDGGTGIVICDWVGAGGDWDLVRALVGFNSILMAREIDWISKPRKAC